MFKGVSGNCMKWIAVAMRIETAKELKIKLEECELRRSRRSSH